MLALAYILLHQRESNANFLIGKTVNFDGLSTQ